MSDTNSKKEIAIVFGATGNLTFALGNVLIGLKKHSPDLKADIIVYEQGITEKDKTIINSIIPCNFKKYHFPHQGHLTEETLKKFSELTFSRFECFDLLEEYKKVLWLDVDILIKKDITSLFDQKKSGISLVPGDLESIDFTIDIEGLRAGDWKYNAGVLYLQDDLPYSNQLKDWCYKKTVEMSKYLKCADQGIINLMIKEFSLDVFKMNIEYNFNPAYKNDSRINHAKILHTFCPEKFWNYWIEPEWDENYEAWVKMGGAKYQGQLWKRKFKNIPNPFRRPKKFICYLTGFLQTKKGS